MNTEKKLKKLWKKMSKNSHLSDCKDRSCKICSEIRHVVNQDAPFYASIVVFNPTGDLVLLGRRKEDDIWTSPGGHAYKGETPKQAALREAFEETGITFNSEALIELPTLQTYQGKPAHCFMVFSPTHQEPIVTNDPDRELKEWKWFGINENLPEPMDENRTRNVMNAKMKLKGLIKSRQDTESLKDLYKAIVMNENIPGVDLNTAEYSMDALAAKNNPVLNDLDGVFGSMKYGDLPKDTEINNGTYKLSLSLVDLGIYSGWVKDVKTGDVVIRLEKMTMPSIVQALEAKQVIQRPTQELKESAILPPPEAGSSNVLINSDQPEPQLAEKVKDIVEEHEAKWEDDEGSPEEQDADAEAFEEVEALVENEHKSSELPELLDNLKNIQAQHLHIHIHKSLKDLEGRLK